jgi:transcriptional regulator with XRE-family HTH domain
MPFEGKYRHGKDEHIEMSEESAPISRAELARQLGVSRTYITLLIQGKRQPSSQLVDQIRQLQLTSTLPPEIASANIKWGSGDLNPDAFRHKILSLARLPIPTLPRIYGLHTRRNDEVYDKKYTKIYYF